MKKITVLTDYGRIPLFFTAKPFFLDEKNNYYFTRSIDYCMKKDKNSFLFLIRNPKNDNDFQSNIQGLRKKYKKIYYFDDDARAIISRPDLIPYVDKYFKGKIYKDKTEYFSETNHMATFAKYYFTKNNMREKITKSSYEINHKDLEKIELSWNLGIGFYPMSTKIFRTASLISLVSSPKIGFYFLKNVSKFIRYKKLKNKKTINAQFSDQGNYHGLHRKAILSVLKEFSNVITEKTSNREFNNNIASSVATISPFGWGEICFRDFEAIYAKSLLVKPKMSHLETWPDIYQESFTYISIEWDHSNLKTVVEEIQNSPNKYMNVVKNAERIYFGEIAKLQSKVDAIIATL